MRWFIYQAVPGMHMVEWLTPLADTAHPDGLDLLQRSFTKAFKKAISAAFVSYNPNSGTPYFLFEVGSEIYFASDLPMKVLGELSATEIWS